MYFSWENEQKIKEVAKTCDWLCELTFQEKDTFYLGTFLIFSRNSFSKRTPHTPVQYTHTYFFVTGHLLFNHFWRHTWLKVPSWI